MQTHTITVELRNGRLQLFCLSLEGRQYGLFGIHKLSQTIFELTEFTYLHSNEVVSQSHDFRLQFGYSSVLHFPLLNGIHHNSNFYLDVSHPPSYVLETPIEVLALCWLCTAVRGRSTSHDLVQQSSLTIHFSLFILQLSLKLLIPPIEPYQFSRYVG